MSKEVTVWDILDWEQIEVNPLTNEEKSIWVFDVPGMRYRKDAYSLILSQEEYQAYKCKLDWQQVLTAAHVDFKVRSTGTLVSLCQLHSEKTPSAFYYPKSKRFHCYGCGNGLDIIEFIAIKYFNCDVIDSKDMENFYRGLSGPLNDPRQTTLPLVYL